MTTALEIIRGTARYLEIIGATQTLNADDAEYALELLNDYLSGLNARGGFYAGGTLGLGSTVAVPDELIGTLKKALAKEMSSGFAIVLGERIREVMAADAKMVSATHRVPIVSPDGVLKNSYTASDYGRN